MMGMQHVARMKVLLCRSNPLLVESNHRKLSACKKNVVIISYMYCLLSALDSSNFEI